MAKTPETAQAPAPQLAFHGGNLTVHDGKIVIVIPVPTNAATLSLSKSGKSRLVASTNGNVEIPGSGGCKLGLNCYIPVS